MKRLKFLLEERARIAGEMQAIMAKCETENRSRTAEEKTAWATLKGQADAMEDEITDLQAQQQIDQRSATPKGTPPADPAKPKDLSLRGQVADWQARNAEAIKQIRSGTAAALTPFEYRAADSPMTPTTVHAGSSISIGATPVIQGGGQVIDLLRVQPTLWDLIPKGRTTLETYPWVNKKVPAESGAADYLAPGSAKPKVSFTLEVEKSNAKKPAVSIKVATELLEDIDGMTSFMETELRYQLKNHINGILMSANAATATDPAGILSFANAYTLTGVWTDNANNYDASQAAIAQIRAAHMDGPVLVGMNPVDVTNMRLTKAISQGQYMGLNLLPVPGGFIVEDYNIVAGNILAFAVDALKTLIYKDFRIAYGWENDDFTKNLVTAIAETRIHQFHSDNHAAAFVYDSLDDIKAAITTV